MMRFASLGSGSRGNATVVEAGRTRILVDCGFGPRLAAARLARLGLAPADIDAVLVTHEHSDHVGGVAAFAARHGTPILMTHGTREAAGWNAAVQLFDSHTPFAVGDLEISPFPVPHDAREPAQFVFSDGGHRLGLVTDAGHVTSHMVAMLAACDALVLECNHDAAMLAGGSYPYPLKRRIAGPFGHLDNAAAADLLRQVAHGGLQHVVCAHLSQENNRAELATAALAAVLGCTSDWIVAADQDRGFDWLSVV
ncbi:MAG TPA: MBL fold metallo-hydrolase [Rhodocyclaceae bacterium]